MSSGLAIDVEGAYGSRWKRYPAYRDSGVEWLGEVPENWQVERLRFHISINPTKSEVRRLAPDTSVSFIPMEAVGEYGGICLDQTRPIEDVSAGYTYFHEGDVVVAKITPCFENVKRAVVKGLTNGIGFGTTELHVLRPNYNIDRYFLFYLTLSYDFRKLGESEMYGSAGQKRVPEEFIKNLKHPIPSLPEQRAIAAFLYRETGRIDALIAKKERQIELLREKRTALISHAVTKGLDPDAPMKDSGVEWLGEVPDGWTVKGLRFLFQFLDNYRIPVAGEDRAAMAKIFPYYGASGIIDYVDDYIFNETLILVAEDGANLLSRSTPLAFIATGKYWVNNHAHILRPINGQLHFWERVLQTYDYSPLITGAAQPKLTKENLGSILLPCPPIDEQRAIAAFLNTETGRIDVLATKVHESISKFREYHTALISAAVTGKIDVREELVS